MLEGLNQRVERTRVLHATKESSRAVGGCAVMQLFDEDVKAGRGEPLEKLLGTENDNRPLMRESCGREFDHRSPAIRAALFVDQSRDQVGVVIAQRKIVPSVEKHVGERRAAARFTQSQKRASRHDPGLALAGRKARERFRQWAGLLESEQGHHRGAPHAVDRIGKRFRQPSDNGVAVRIVAGLAQRQDCLLANRRAGIKRHAVAGRVNITVLSSLD